MREIEHGVSAPPTISVIIPVYNTEQYLRRCIDSVLAQTYQDFELLLIDDGSKDSSGAICDEYAAQDARVSVFHKENGGVSSARNVGLDNAQGEWITFVDSDDYIEENFLKSFEGNLDADLVVGNSTWLDNGGTEINSYNISLIGMSREELISRYLYSGMFNMSWGKFYKASLIRRYGIRFNEIMRFAEDLCFVYQFLFYSKKITSVVDTPFCRYLWFVPCNSVLKYSMSTHEASIHFSNVWESYKKIGIRCLVFEEKIINDIFELCKMDIAKNPSPWYKNKSIKEACVIRAKRKGLCSIIRTIFVFLYGYKLKYYLC